MMVDLSSGRVKLGRNEEAVLDWLGGAAPSIVSGW